MPDESLPTAPGRIKGFARPTAVVVGIDRYSHGIAALANARRDASRIAELLEKRHGYEVLLCLDEAATLSGLRALIRDELGRRKPDQMIMFFAGHGLAETDERGDIRGSLLPFDAVQSEPDTFWSMTELRTSLASLEIRHLLVILDCCFAGAFSAAVMRDFVAPGRLYHESYDHYLERRASQLIVSCAHDERAFDRLSPKQLSDASVTAEHSPFARALIDALDVGAADLNKDDVSTATDIYAYARARLAALQYPGSVKQTPGLWLLEGHDQGEFVFRTGQRDLPRAEALTEQRNPYRGLEPFGREHDSLFFGRDETARTLRRRIEDSGTRYTVVVGPSGSGKSSLVRAGVMARLPADRWEVPDALRPGRRPMQRLTRWLAGLRGIEPGADLGDPDDFAAGVTEWSIAHPDRTLLLAVDPLEEAEGAAEGELFLESIGRAVRRCPALRVVLALRSDFASRFTDLDAPTTTGRQEWRDAQFRVPAMNRDELRLCIELPAQRRVLFFESRELVDRLLDDFERMPGALPLLSLTLSELFLVSVRRAPLGRTLTLQDYRAIGGAVGVLRDRTRKVFRKELEDTLRRIMLRTVSFEGNSPVRRRVPYSELAYGDNAEDARVQEALELLCAGRLIVADGEAAVGPARAAADASLPASEAPEPDGEAFFEPAHDWLLTGWPWLNERIAREHERLRLHRQLTQAALDWRRTKAVWSGALLSKLRVFDARSPAVRASPPRDLSLSARLLPWCRERLSAGYRRFVDLWHEWWRLDYVEERAERFTFNAAEAGFIEASLKSRRRWRIVLMVLVSVFLALLAWGRVRIDEEAKKVAQAIAQAQLKDRMARDSAVQAQLKARMARDSARLGAAREALAQRNVSLALGWLRETEAEDPGSELAGWNRLAAEALATRGRAQLTFDHGSGVADARVDPAGIFAVTLSRETVRTWDLSTGEQTRTLTPAGKFVALDTSGAVALAVSKQALSLYDTRAGTQTRSIPLERPVKGLTLSGDGSWIAAFSGGTVHLWDARSGALVANIAAPAGEEGEPDILWEPADPKRAFLKFRTRIYTWDVAAGALGVPAEHPKPIRAADVSGDGRLLATVADADGPESNPPSELALWDTRDMAKFAAKETERWTTFVRFNRDGSKLATVSPAKVVLWRLKGAELQSSEALQHDVSITETAFSPDDSHVITLAQGVTESRAFVWDPRELEKFPIAVLAHDSAPTAASFVPGTPRAMTVSRNGTVTVWDVKSGAELAILARGDRNFDHVRCRSDDGSAVTIAREGPAQLWDLRTGELVATDGDPGRFHDVAFSRAGMRVARVSADGHVDVFDSRSGNVTRVSGQGGSPSVVRLDRSGTRVVVAAGRTATVFDVATGKQIARVAHEGEINDVVFNAAGDRLLSASSDRTARVWDVRTGTQLARLVHEDPVSSVVALGADDRVATTSSGASLTATVWDTPTGVALRTRDIAKPGHTVSFSLDGKIAMSYAGLCVGHSVSVWHMDDDSRPITITPKRTVCTAALSPDGGRVVTGTERDDDGKESEVKIWSTANGDEITAYGGHTDNVEAGSYCDDGGLLITAAREARVWWDATAGGGPSALQKLWSATPLCPSARLRQAVLGQSVEAAEQDLEDCRAMTSCVANTAQDLQRFTAECLKEFKQRVRVE